VLLLKTPPRNAPPAQAPATPQTLASHARAPTADSGYASTKRSLPLIAAVLEELDQAGQDGMASGEPEPKMPRRAESEQRKDTSPRPSSPPAMSNANRLLSTAWAASARGVCAAVTGSSLACGCSKRAVQILWAQQALRTPARAGLPW
jgi:hypothetical protein